jgi:deoxyribose-phosphate aldolase
MGHHLTSAAVAAMIDHSLLHPTLTDDEMTAGCTLARTCRTAAVCVKPYAVRAAVAALKGSGVAVCAVAAFPHGHSVVSLKVQESETAIGDGATEIDVVVNIGKVKSGDWRYVSDEIRMVNAAVTARGALLKVIFENDFLEDGEIIRLCAVCAEHRVAFVKTSTGYGFVKRPDGAYSYAGATIRHLKLMRAHCPPAVKIKAAGGIRTLDELLAAREAGAERIGASATQSILAEAAQRFQAAP